MPSANSLHGYRNQGYYNWVYSDSLTLDVERYERELEESASQNARFITWTIWIMQGEYI